MGPKVRALKTITFVYEAREDRILAVLNAGLPEAWSCWLTRRLTLALLERTAEFVANTSALAQRVPADLRGESVAFEREAAIASTAKSMSNTPPTILRATAGAAALADRVTIANQGDKLRLEFRGQGEDGAAGALSRAELQRVLQMLQGEVAKSGWMGAPAKPQAAAPPAAAPDAKPVRH
jgi:hypothetical protein